jgi:YHS domain-containing protein
MQLRLLNESGPQFDTLEKSKVKLTDTEREKVMSSKAIWHFGSNGKPSPAIKKAIVGGKTYYYCNTHRCYQSAKTLDSAIKKFFKVVKPSS